MFKKMDQNTLLQFEKWVKSGEPERLLRPNASFLLRRTRGIQKITFNSEMESFTDGDNITVSGIPFFVAPEYGPEYWLEIMRINMAHEFQHANSSRFDIIKSIRTEYGEYMHTNFDINHGYAAKIAQSVLNCTEDGRINEIVIQDHPGYFAGMRMVNYGIREMNEIEGIAQRPGEELVHFLSQILVYSKTGLDAIGITCYKGERLEAEFLKIRDLIDKAVWAKTALECKELTYQLLVISAPYIAELAKSESKIQDFLDQIASEMYSEFCESNEEQTADDDHSDSPRYQSPKEPASTQPSADLNENKQSDDGESDSGSRNENKDGEDKPSGNGECGQKTQEETSQAKETSKNASDQRQESGDGNSKEKGDKPTGDSHAESIKGVIGSFGDGLSDYSPDTMGEIEIRKTLDSVAKLLKGSGEAPADTTKCQPTPLSAEDRRMLSGIYSKLDFKESYVSPKNGRITPALKKEATVLHEKLTKILARNRVQMSAVRKGVLDPVALWKVGIESQDVFRRKSPPKECDCAVYELIDRSGSMNELAYTVGSDRITKLHSALSTAAVMEESLKSIAATKVSLFCAAVHYSTELTIVKDFDQTGDGNRCVDALQQILPSGGNMDGAAIRIAAMDLAKRPEKTKILIVLSDGLPSAYLSEEQAIADVHSAVKWARSQGIIVVSVMYGNTNFLKRSLPTYKKMYEQGIVACRPADILQEFTRILTTLVR